MDLRLRCHCQDWAVEGEACEATAQSEAEEACTKSKAEGEACEAEGTGNERPGPPEPTKMDNPDPLRNGLDNLAHRTKKRKHTTSNVKFLFSASDTWTPSDSLRMRNIVSGRFGEGVLFWFLRIRSIDETRVLLYILVSLGRGWERRLGLGDASRGETGC